MSKTFTKVERDRLMTILERTDWKISEDSKDQELVQDLRDLVEERTEVLEVTDGQA